MVCRASEACLLLLRVFSVGAPGGQTFRVSSGAMYVVPQWSIVPIVCPVAIFSVAQACVHAGPV